MVASDLAEVAWEQVALSLFADAAVAASYILLLFIIVFLNREKKISIFLPRRTYVYAFFVVLGLNGIASLASLHVTGAAVTLTYKLLVAALLSFTVAAVWRVLPRRTGGKGRGEAIDPGAMPDDAARAKLLEIRETIDDKVREHRLRRLGEELEKEAAGDRAATDGPRTGDLIVHTSTATAVLDAAGTVLDANPALARLLGRASVEELMNRDLSRLMGTKSDGPLREFIDQTLKDGTCGAVIAVSPAPRGPIRIEATGAATTCDGKPCIIALLLDVTASPATETDLIQSREALAAALEAAQRTNATKSAFMAKMNHELRTPLNGIIGMAEVLRHRAMEDRLSSNDVLRMTETIQESGTHLLSLVDDLLDLSQLESGSRTLSPSVINVRRAIDAATTTLASISDKKRIRILNQCDEKVEWAVDPRAFKQIIINLVNNAVKFSPQGSRVFIRVTHGTEMMRLSVFDEGQGISQHDRMRILLPFSRGEAAETQQAEGVGLGLTIVSELLKLQGGTLEIGNVKTGGAVFTAVFPVTAPAQPEPTPEQPAS